MRERVNALYSPNRRYISSETTLRNLYEGFLIENHDHCTYSSYHAVFKKENIGFEEFKEGSLSMIHEPSTKIYKKIKNTEGLYISQEKKYDKDARSPPNL